MKEVNYPLYKEGAYKHTYTKPPRLDPRSTAQLINLALAAADEDDAWEYIYALQDRGTLDVLETARALCLTGRASERILGANILGQGFWGRGIFHPLITSERILGANILGQGTAWDKSYNEEAVTTLLVVLAQEQDPQVLNSVAVALGHRHDPRAIAPLVGLKVHPDREVRYGVVFGLLSHADDRAVAALIDLSDDSDSEIRDWATFGLGSMIEVDTPAIRDALYARVNDVDDDTRGEAFSGLAQRGDPRVVAPLLAELVDRELDDIGSLLIEAVLAAAQQLRDRQLYPALVRLQGVVSDSDADDWEAALKECWSKYG